MNVNPEDYRFPRFSFDPGWPLVLEFGGDVFVRIRDGSPVERTEGGGRGNECLYVRVTDLQTGAHDTSRMWSPAVSINEGFELSKLVGMHSSPWSSKEELATAGVPVYEIPDVQSVLVAHYSGSGT